MGRSDSPFRRSSKDRCHLDPRSLRQGGSDAEYALSTDVPSAPLPELWLQYYCNKAELDHRWRVPLQAR